MREKACFLEGIFLSAGKNQHLLSISHAPDSFAYIILCTVHDNPESCQVGKITPSLQIKQKRQHLEIHSVTMNSQDMNSLLSNSKNYDLPISTLALLRERKEKKRLNLLSKLISSSKLKKKLFLTVWTDFITSPLA